MKTSELVSAIAKEAQMTKADTKKFVDAAIEVMSKALENDDPIRLENFAVIAPKAVAERQGFNPRTGEKMTIKAHKTISIKAFKVLKDRVNQ